MEKYYIDFLIGEVLRGNIMDGADLAVNCIYKGSYLNLSEGFLHDVREITSDCKEPESVVMKLMFLRDTLNAKSERVGRFEKVSLEQFKHDWVRNDWANKDCPEDIEVIYNSIQLPKRATVGSAGYDIFYPRDIVLAPGESAVIPLGIRCEMKNNWFLAIYPRSGLGFKYRAQLDNTVGIIDSDYYHSDNEGHIQIKVTNDSKVPKTLNVPVGKACCQAIFQQYGMTEDDDIFGVRVRNGGFGSTDK